MKQVITLLFLCIILCSCDEPPKGAKPKAIPKYSEKMEICVEDTSESLIKKGKGKPVIVVDETGKEHILKLDHMDMKYVGREFPEMIFPTNYSQVVNNHYYFLRADGKRNYTVYRDKREKVGKFSLKKGIVVDFTYYGNKFYAVVAKNYFLDGGTKLMEIDLKSHIIREVNLAQESKSKKGFHPLMLYRGAYFYHNKRYKNTIAVYDLEGSRAAIRNLCSNEMVKGPCIDDKIYYVKVSKRIMKIYSYDLRSHQRKKILEFEGAYKKEVKEGDYLFSLEFDSDYIYCNGYLIPRKGGKIVRVSYGDGKNERIPEFFLDDYSPMASSFVYNKKYIFYIDNEERIHRMNKVTLNDVIISDPEKNEICAMDIRCTDTGLYVQDYKDKVSMDDEMYEDDHDYLDYDTEVETSCDLYYMDLNGEHIERIWKGKDG